MQTNSVKPKHKYIEIPKPTVEPCGILLVNKHSDCTSHDIVGKCRMLFGTKKVGHTGTLDPMATGVLVILIGRAAKASEYLCSDNKKYIAGMKLGIITDTEDTSGEVTMTSTEIPSEDTVREVCKSFVGNIQQIPPMYSALKQNGVKLVDLARKGVEVERQSRDIEIRELNCEKISDDEYSLEVDCSKGTYIRTLCADIGKALGCGAAMSSLIRTRSGNFSISEAKTIDELIDMPFEERLTLLKPIESLFEELPVVKLSAFYEKLARAGLEIYQNKIYTKLEVGTRVRMASQNGEFFALGEVMQFENSSAIKPIKMFDISGS